MSYRPNGVSGMYLIEFSEEWTVVDLSNKVISQTVFASNKAI